MTIDKLWTLPILSSEIEDDLEITRKGLDITLKFKCPHRNKKQKIIEIKFLKVLCHMHTSERFTLKLLDSYDSLVSIVDSEWLEALKNHNPSDFEFWNLKHFVIYFDRFGQYQFIAQAYQIIENVVEN